LIRVAGHHPLRAQRAQHFQRRLVFQRIARVGPTSAFSLTNVTSGKSVNLALAALRQTACDPTRHALVPVVSSSAARHV
jgi:hypothetical protein